MATADIRDAALEQVDCSFSDLGDFAGLGLQVFEIGPPGVAGMAPSLVDPRDVAPTIAVIPPHSTENALAAGLGDMFADDLNAFLSRAQEVNVISRLSTAALGHRQMAPGEIGRALNADFVLSGRVAYAGAQVRLRLELADAEDGRVLWAERFDMRAADIEQGNDIVHLVAGHIRKALVMRAMRDVRKQTLSSVRAHNLLFDAVGLMHRLTVQDFMTARRLLNALIERAPDQSAPHAWKARWHVLKAQQGWSDSPEADAAAALDCARRALDIDPENTLALSSEGIVLTNLMRRLDEAEACYDQALDINPNDANARLLRGMLFGFQGRGEAATRDAELALHLAPLDPHRFFYLALASGAAIAAGNYQRALELARQSERMNRSHTSTLRMKIVAQMKLGLEGEARRAADELLQLQPGLRVSNWLRASPSADYEIGHQVARTLRAAGVPD